MNKNCLGCSKTIPFDIKFKKNRKFCNRDCYSFFMKKKPEVVLIPPKVGFLKKILKYFKICK